jgi:hypothetical protein
MVMEKRYEPANTRTNLKYFSFSTGVTNTRRPARRAVKKRRIKFSTIEVAILQTAKRKNFFAKL